MEKENMNENINLNESSSSSSSDEEKIDDFDIDNERLTLIDVTKRIFEKKQKQAKKSLLLQNKRKLDKNNIIVYDSSTKEIKDVFCPSKEELEEFLENCKIKEIDPSEFEERVVIDRNIFSPNEYLKRNNIMKSYVSFDDLEDINNDDKEEILPLINPTISFNFSNFQNEDTPQSPYKGYKKNLDDILNSHILEPSQKKWLNTYINKIIGMNINSVIIKDKKLEIIFDLDSTLIFNFIRTNNKEENDKILEKKQGEDACTHEFEYNDEIIYSSFIIRNGIKEFIDFTKLFCNYHINTLGIEKYAEKIIEKLEKKLKIKIDQKIMRKENKNKKNKKSIREFNCEYIKTSNSVIFDDNVMKWETDFRNVIPSKKFFDRDSGINCIKKNKETNKTQNNLTCLLNSFGHFYYYSFEEDDLNWNNQSLKRAETCPFYYYKERGDEFYFDIYNGEYYDSQRKQFIYMRNVIKIIYYMRYHDEIPIFECIKLIRLNVFYGKYFYLKFVEKTNVEILTQIIRTCGGEIIEPDECLISKMKKIFMVCSFDIYENDKDIIQNEAQSNDCVLVNEKFVLDCFYFMTFIEIDYLDGEYEPHYCNEFKELFFK